MVVDFPLSITLTAKWGIFRLCYEPFGLRYTSVIIKIITVKFYNGLKSIDLELYGNAHS